MDVRSYFRRVREVEARIAGPMAVIVSQATPDGGKEGVINEVPSFLAGQLVVEGKARLATGEESRKYFEQFQSTPVAAGNKKA